MLPCSSVVKSIHAFLCASVSPWLNLVVMTLSFMARPAIGARLILLVAAETPAHPDLDRPRDARHGRDVAVAVGTDAAGPDVHHVREIDMVRHPIDPDPGDRLLVFPVRHKLLDFRRILRNEQMAGPAVGNSGNAGGRGLGRCAVAKKTRNAVVACVDFVAEGNRLYRGTVAQVQRQNIHERQYDDKNNSCCGQPRNKPG